MAASLSVGNNILLYSTLNNDKYSTGGIVPAHVSGDATSRRHGLGLLTSNVPACSVFPGSVGIFKCTDRQVRGLRRGLTTRSRPSFAPRAAGEEYKGVYGNWSVENADIVEVVCYRGGLVTAAASFVTAALSAFLPEGSPVQETLVRNLDVLYATGAGGLGLSLTLIHIYVTPIKRFMQILWLAGVLGSLGVATNFAPPDQGLVQFVLQNPGGIWAVGPLFAALTGLVFKEGLCYGKLEAAVLTLLIPTLLIGHLSGAMAESVELGLLATWMALFTLFAARKFIQPIKDDIGDKSVFNFQKLSKEEQEELVAKLQRVQTSD